MATATKGERVGDIVEAGDVAVEANEAARRGADPS